MCSESCGERVWWGWATEGSLVRAWQRCNHEATVTKTSCSLVVPPPICRTNANKLTQHQPQGLCLWKTHASYCYTMPRLQYQREERKSFTFKNYSDFIDINKLFSIPVETSALCWRMGFKVHTDSWCYLEAIHLTRNDFKNEHHIMGWEKGCSWLNKSPGHLLLGKPIKQLVSLLLREIYSERDVGCWAS